LEFRWYVDGESRMVARLADEDGDGKLLINTEGAGEVERLLRGFLAEEPPKVTSPRELADRMAAMAHEMKGLIERTYEQEGQRGQLHGQLEAFRKTLLPDLRPLEFADMYAQTIAYGLFAARTMAPAEGFSRWNAARDLPKTNPFLRQLFYEIAGPNLDSRVDWIVDGLAELLKRAEMDAILKDFGQRTRREDPVVHFYETFLSHYDPKMRELRGVYYTPEPVVSYIVRSVDHLLKKKFGRSMGLADTNTLILDPATGTGTFLYHVIRRIHEELDRRNQGGAWSAYVRENLLRRIFGFELLMAPYTVAHMKLGILLKDLDYDFGGEERLRVYLTNTLEEGFHPDETIGFAEFIAEEADAAATIKKDEPIEVIIGNPPYSGHSANKGPWIADLIDTYKHVDGQPLGERNPKWLNDDYVKFMRFGQWRVEKTGRGVLAFITNHGYLDNPTFRGMRESLMRTFTAVYLLDLHGNSLKNEKTPEGGKDENVFDIQQGVAIGIFIKEQSKTGPAKVYHADLWGLRAGKYEEIAKDNVNTTKWTELAPTSPSYLFTPQDTGLLSEYEQGWNVTEVMPVNAPGVVTGQDKKTIAFDKDQAEVLAERQGLSANVVAPILYRPFDRRHVIYDPGVVTRPRFKVMRHMLAGDNIGLVTVRKIPPGAKARYFMVAGGLIVNGAIRSDNQSIDSLFPLYLYPQAHKFLDTADQERRPNLSPQFTKALSEELGLRFISDGGGDLLGTFGPEDVFDYAYAVFHSPTYRERYAEFLKHDFPRLPLTSDRALFAALTEKGAEMVGLHLMTSPSLDSLITRFPEDGDNTVEKGRYDEATSRVYINKVQYFEGVLPEVWQFRVGGYQVLDKWLKDRKGRTLSFEDIMHYQRIVVALSETQRIMQEIDETIPDWPLQ
jgi:predicted helicase